MQLVMSGRNFHDRSSKQIIRDTNDVVQGFTEQWSTTYYSSAWSGKDFVTTLAFVTLEYHFRRNIVQQLWLSVLMPFFTGNLSSSDYHWLGEVFTVYDCSCMYCIMSNASLCTCAFCIQITLRFFNWNFLARNCNELESIFLVIVRGYSDPAHHLGISLDNSLIEEKDCILSWKL